ncbi:hypothetical protein GUJ93_ZPchr0012g19745 [Zizania palustris]|uniref:U1-type domain-containing protein n=1 Tax=Zizania palustris TaxID=103762 RepID=A0A8J6BWL2_ZIZPA|nr:hypothetical protein GUJ93_ZPchr0012g19745 [Zizania palustris]
MEFRFRATADDAAASCSSPALFSNPRRGYFGARGMFLPPAHAGAPGPLRGGPVPPLESEEATRFEGIIRQEVERRLIQKEVERRLIEDEARREFAFAHGLHGWFVRDPFAPPLPRMGMRGPSPLFEKFGAWKGFGPHRHAGLVAPFRFVQMMLPGPERSSSPPLPDQKLELREIEPGGNSEVSSETKVLTGSKMKRAGVKRKADAIPATTGSGKVKKPAQDWSCALCQVSATSEAGLNDHLHGKRHKAKLAQRRPGKAIKVSKSSLKQTNANNDSTGPSDAPKKICIQVDGAMHEVVQKSNYVWCDRCKVRCNNNLTMADHLRSKKHSCLTRFGHP